MARRIDGTHTPDKRTLKFGPGPKKRKFALTDDWNCVKGKNTSTHYVQVCTWKGDGNRAVATIRTNKKKKKAYNKLYRKFAKRSARIKALTKRGPRRNYKCRSTRVSKCR
jgi:hypothetical protein